MGIACFWLTMLFIAFAGRGFLHLCRMPEAPPTKGGWNVSKGAGYSNRGRW